MDVQVQRARARLQLVGLVFHSGLGTLQQEARADLTNAVEQAELFTDAARSDTEAVEAKLPGFFVESVVRGDGWGCSWRWRCGRASAGCYAACIA